jgi:hypothetical protein
MEGFDKEEWMEEMGVRESKTWKVFRVPVRLEYCDIRLKDGREVGPCWPRMGSDDFLFLGNEEDEYGFGDVTHIRYYEEGRVEKEEEEEEEDDD